MTLHSAWRRFVRDRKDLFVTGPTGNGKSYLVTALGNKACQDGFRVLYASTAKLITGLKIAKAKGTILTELKRIERADLLILDELASPSSFAPWLSSCRHDSALGLASVRDADLRLARKRHYDGYH